MRGSFRPQPVVETSMDEHKKIAVVLFQLGEPDSLAAVEPFLYNLFSDPDIIALPLGRFARLPLARLIASARAKKLRNAYAAIGGKSPIGDLTRRQARALELELRKEIDAKVFVAMRYWHPLTEEAVAELRAAPFHELVLLPLYPQYSKTTTGSSWNEWNRKYRPAAGNHLPVRWVRHFYNHPSYIDALVEKVNRQLERFASPEDVHLVFSAHGVPASVIESGDPYQEQVEATRKLVVERGRWPCPHILCYQSRVGPGRWLEPGLHATIHSLAANGAKNVLVIPVSFVSDHIETLNEIDIEVRAEAMRLGITHFEMMPALNDSPKFIRALAELVWQAVGLLQGKEGYVESSKTENRDLPPAT